MLQKSHKRSKNNITIEGIKRSYLLYVPSTYDPLSQTPLVISLHGFADWPARHEKMTRWDDLAEEKGCIVVYPSGTGFPLRWAIDPNLPAKLTPSLEVAFLSQLMDHLVEEYNIDPRRIYANGFSNGGGMAALLGCQLSERITAVGVVAPAVQNPPESCNFTRPVPMIVFHGTSDPVVPYDGGSFIPLHGSFPKIPDWVRQVAKKYGCSPEPEKLPDCGEVSGIRYTRCEGEEVVLYTVHGGGHAWPGGKPLPGAMVGHTTEDIDATREMWAFFIRYSL